MTLAAVGGYIVFSVILSEWRIKFVRRMNDADTEANAKAIDSLLNYETVKYFGNEEHEARRFDVGRRRYEQAAIRSSRTLSLLNIGQGAIISLGLVAVMVMAGYGVVAGTMTLGDFVAVNAFLIQLYMPLNMLGFAYREIRNALVNMESMFGLLDVPAEIADKPGAPALKVAGGEIVFDHVDFHYEKARPILHDVSFRVAPGNTVAIVGSSGAGKSTVSRILFRFYDVAAGSVRIDGQDIRDVTQSSLRAAIGVVPQDTVLFNDTIYYNICYGRPDATREEVEQAARLARIHDFIMALPQGYESTVGERGLKLSGGEKQRVAIARTILKNPQHPAVRRGDQRARHAHRAGDPALAGRGEPRPHHRGDRPSAVDHHQRRRDRRARPRPRRRARPPWRIAGPQRPLCRHVAPPAGGRPRGRAPRRGGRGTALVPRRGASACRRLAKPQAPPVPGVRCCPSSPPARRSACRRARPCRWCRWRSSGRATTSSPSASSPPPGASACWPPPRTSRGSRRAWARCRSSSAPWSRARRSPSPTR